MINAKSEIKYILVTQVLKDMVHEGILSDDEFAAAKRLAEKKYCPSTVWES